MTWPPAERRKPRHVSETARLPNGPLGERADSKDSTSPYTLIAISRHGKRIVAGRYASREIADRNAGILRRLARLTGGDVEIEYVGSNLVDEAVR